VEMAAAMVGCKGAASAGRRWLPSTPLRLRPRGPGSSLNLADVGRRRAVRAPAPSARTRADADHGGAARPAGRGGERRRRTGRGWEQWRRPSLPVEHLAGTSVSCRSPGFLSSGRALQETGREMSGGRMRMTILGKWGVVYRCNFAIQLLGFLGI